MKVVQRLGRAGVALGVAACLLYGCASSRKGEPDKPAAPTPVVQPAGSSRTVTSPVTPSSEQPARNAKAPFKMGPPERPRDWDHARLQAAHRLVAANPEISYMGKPPDMLLAIPVLTIELNGDGSVRNITVMRYPSQARDTVNTAIAAVRKAAPFGDISRLPKPWKFNETFLFNAERKFKPMTLDRL
jgi:hypothetical protein